MLYEIIHALFHNTIFIKYGLLGLFFNGMFSSFIPIPTEITISALLLGKANVFDVFVVLVVGSTIGGYIAYYIGYNGRLLKKLRKTPEEKYEQKSINIMTKYGWFTIIFLSPWIPILGDVVSIVAGTKKYSIVKYSIAMTTGKTVKAVAIVFFGVHFIQWLVRILH
ncbi:MAG: DedA family protein [Thaumarchaeota archaeon]|nr:DedA family protein [Nitrososphaerota archaeon]MDE1830991.1 DedA family protein [Nitrososphaerota archaeon]MDE1840938.1 DedA family protein [Nitrososphaerota archaeon]MDE1877188.1 DedA family protein [Nitrososphaerota archaeon]